MNACLGFTAYLLKSLPLAVPSITEAMIHLISGCTADETGFAPIPGIPIGRDLSRTLPFRASHLRRRDTNRSHFILRAACHAEGVGDEAGAANSSRYRITAPSIGAIPSAA
jgi:hypothetical protein